MKTIGHYQDQMVAFKRNAAEAGLDWGTPMPADVPFHHLDTVLGRFVDGLAKLKSMPVYEYRSLLKRSA